MCQPIQCLQHLNPIMVPDAGCPAVTGSLWDVTDRDLDRFCMAHLGCWLKENIKVINECSSHETATLQQLDPQRAQVRLDVQLADSLAQSRHACHLGSLVGAAPVCYGLPTSCQLNIASDPPPPG